jgi:hypothetical protein
MRKPRMTRSEKAFVAWANVILFATPEIRDGQAYLDRQAWATLSPENQQRYVDLVIGKTR